MGTALRSINDELLKKPLDMPSTFWKSHGTFHAKLLSAYGPENFKRTVSHFYQNWLMVTLDDPQFRRLLTTWARHRRIEPFDQPD